MKECHSCTDRDRDKRNGKKIQLSLFSTTNASPSRVSSMCRVLSLNQVHQPCGSFQAFYWQVHTDRYSFPSMNSRGKWHSHNHYRCVVGIRVGTIATDTPTLSQMIVKNKATQTLFECSQQATTKKSVVEAKVIAIHKQVFHITLISSTSSRLDIDQVSRSGKVLGVPWRGRLDQHGPCMLCFSKSYSAVSSRGGNNTSAIHLWLKPDQRGQHQECAVGWVYRHNQ